MPARSVQSRRQQVAVLRAVTALLLAWPTPSSAQSHTPPGHRENAAITRYDPIFRKYGKRYFGIGFDWRLLKAQAMAESQLNPDARSQVGARGLMQLMPATFQNIQSQRPEFRSIDDPEWNIAAGVMHDRYLWKLWDGSVAEEQRSSFMFGSYNAGEGTITRAAAIAKAKQLDHTQWSTIEQVAPTVPHWRWKETVDYVHKIDAGYQRLVGGR